MTGGVEKLLAAQQASLRRVATLVASGAGSGELFAAIAEEVGHVTGLPLVAVWRYEADDFATVLGAWGDRPHPFAAGTRWPLDGPTICARVRMSGAPERIDDFSDLPGTLAQAARTAGIRGCAGAPIIVDGEVWGAMSADSTDEAPLPDDIQERLAGFTELVAATFSTTARQDEVARLADEQAALRRVATLVAQDVPPSELFAAVARELGELLEVSMTHVARLDAGGWMTAVGAWRRDADPTPVGTRRRVNHAGVSGRVVKTGRPARKDHYDDGSADATAQMRELGVRSSVAAPIVLNEKLWGMMIASSSRTEPLPTDTESRMGAFTELVSVAIANSQARAETERLVAEQAALRRVATLVAQSVPPNELFAAVAEEVGTLMGADFAGLVSYGKDRTVASMATWAADGEHPAVPTQWPVDDDDPAMLMVTTRAPARTDDWDGVAGPLAAFLRDEMGVCSSIASPVFVDARVWGALVVHSKDARPLPADTESRLLRFTELIATAIANVDARAEVQRLADEQASLRRVATLVARESSPGDVFAAVTEEAGRLLHIDNTALLRYEQDGTATVTAAWGPRGPMVAVGTHVPLEGESVTARVLRTGRPARIDDYTGVTGTLGSWVRDSGGRSVVGTPIVVEGRLWGTMLAGSLQVAALPADTEEQIAKFTELVATAIANMQAREDLAASRARVVAAADDERRRVVRDLHDGAQQRLVHTIITLKLARRALQRGEERGAGLVGEALEQAERANVEVRELAHGILPAVLTRGGLRATVAELATRAPVPVEVAVTAQRLSADVEATAYFVIAEALTNVAKHARATSASVRAEVAGRMLTLEVRDDGVGGARPEGAGLVGLADRLAVLDGELRIDSPAGGGTLVAAEIPVPARTRSASRG